MTRIAILILLLRSWLESNFSSENIEKKKKKKNKKYRDVADIYIAWLYLRKSYEINVEIEIFFQIFLSYGFLKFLFLN